MKISEINFTDSIQTALSGDMRGFEFIYNQTYRYYRAMVIKYFPNPDEAEDLLQDIYLRLYEKLKDLRAPENFFPWSKVLVQNAIKNELRHRSGKMLSNIEYRPMYASEEEGTSLEDISLTDYEREYNRKSFLEEYNPELSAENLERKELLDEMLNALPDMQRTCILLWQEGYSTKEMAETLNIPTGTVLSNINYAKKKIKANVLALEKKGTKLYGMAPLTFFLWVLEQFDLLYPDTLPAKGNTVLWGEISKACGNLLEQAAQTTANVISDATQGNTAETAMEQSSASLESSITSQSSEETVEIVQEGMTAAGKTGAAKTGSIAASTVVKGTATFTGHSLVVKIVAILAVVVTVGTGGYFGYKHIKTTSNAFVDIEDKKNSNHSSTKEEKTTKTEDYQEIYSEVLKNYQKAILKNWGYEDWAKLGYSEEHTGNLFETYNRTNTQEYNASVGETITMKSDGLSLKELAEQFTYAYIDIDGDETHELLLTDNSVADSSKGIYISALYTIKNGKPELLLTSRPRSSYYLCDNAIISLFESGGAFVHSWTYYEYTKNGLNFKVELLYDEQENAQNPYFYSEKEDVDKENITKENYTSISNEKANSIMESYSKPFTNEITFYPLLNVTTESETDEKVNKFFTQEQMDKIRRDLGVPDSDTITAKVNDTSYWWEGAGIYLVCVDFIENGESVAHADVDIETADICTSIFVYSAKTASDNINSSYILSNSASAYLTDADVKNLSKKELRIARNEIMARHGRQFKDSELKSYFESKSWYSGTVAPEEFDASVDSILNKYEKHNIELIKKYESN